MWRHPRKSRPFRRPVEAQTVRLRAESRARPDEEDPYAGPGSDSGRGGPLGHTGVQTRRDHFRADLARPGVGHDPAPNARRLPRLRTGPAAPRLHAAPAHWARGAPTRPRGDATCTWAGPGLGISWLAPWVEAEVTPAGAGSGLRLPPAPRRPTPPPAAAVAQSSAHKEMRKIPSNGNLKMTKVAYPLGLLVSLFIYVAYIKWHWASATQAFFSITEVATGARRGQQARTALGTAARGHEVFYGIMFDAGSTGTRVHVFQFTRQPRGTPTLTHETFKALKPGLSAYADDVEKSTPGIQELLDVAKQDIPFDFWKATPLVLKATAGLRLLPGEKAQKLLEKVKEVFKASPFLVGDDCVSIMNGTDEGVSAWITINFLTGSLETPGRSSVGMLDLGGGSTQITFLPRVEGTLHTSPPGHLTSLQMFNRTYKLYSYRPGDVLDMERRTAPRASHGSQPLTRPSLHSYLGLGLMSARLAILGGVEGTPAADGKELVSPCLSPSFKGEWEHAEITYRISGQKAVNLHELCASRVSEILRNQVHRVAEVKDVDFYAFSYYYDLAANVGLIDAEKGGSLTVGDFEIAAKYVCRTVETQPQSSPFLCMDLTYVSLLLREFGFPGNKVLKLTRKIDNVETSWALGAAFHYIDSLNSRKSRAS
ncbi:ectonucleoside triphosphate diphosphohydrolase 6 isoform X5 [Equus asinus]|uniref:ectonucleoside triphosphate diphosphohydrolase 6 isoform X5 n=1 Tax=Equus asinus TaxID=9793 RepID=UPI0038F5F258